MIDVRFDLDPARASILPHSPLSAGILQIREVAEDALCIKGLNRTHVELEIGDEMLHRTNDGVVGPQQLCLVLLVLRIVDRLK